jgi:hypothetical protein
MQLNIHLTARGGEAGMAQKAQLHREAETVVIAAPLADRRQVGLGKRVLPVSSSSVIGRKGKLAGSLGGR